jgi:hypothetical protein
MLTNKLAYKFHANVKLFLRCLIFLTEIQTQFFLLWIKQDILIQKFLARLCNFSPTPNHGYDFQPLQLLI